MPHGGVVRLGEEEAEAELVDRAFDVLRRQLELEAERLEHVRGARLRRRGAVAVLRDGRARRRGNEGGRRGDVVRVRAVATGADDVDDVGALRVDAEDVLAHRLGAAGDLGRGLALHAQRDEEAGDLAARRLAGSTHRHRRPRLVPRQVVAVEQPRKPLLNHSRPSRKLRASAGPSGVSTDSGMELDADRRQLPVPHRHHLAVLRECGRLERVRQRVAASEW